MADNTQWVTGHFMNNGRFKIDRVESDGVSLYNPSHSDLFDNRIVLNSNKHNMAQQQHLSKELAKHLPKDVQTQYKAGFLNSELNLTSSGLFALGSILKEKFSKEFTEAAAEVLKEKDRDEE